MQCFPEAAEHKDSDRAQCVLFVELITWRMLQSLLRLLASEEEKSADAEQLDVSLQKLPWAQLEEKTMLVQFHSFLMKFN